jgi:hypothetical protein
MMTVIAIVLAAGCLVMFFRWRLRQPLMPESLCRVESDDASITVTYPRGERQVVEWSKLTRVAIRTTDDGPWDMDLFWGLHENGSSAATAIFPGGATGERPLMEALYKRLPGLRIEEITKAMSSTSNDYFIVWESGVPESTQSIS